MNGTVYEVNSLDENDVITGSGNWESFYDAVHEYNEMGSVAKELVERDANCVGSELYSYNPSTGEGTVKIGIPLHRITLNLEGEFEFFVPSDHPEGSDPIVDFMESLNYIGVANKLDYDFTEAEV